MLNHFAVARQLGIAAEFFAFHEQVIPPFQHGRNAQAVQQGQHRFCEDREVHKVVLPQQGVKREVQVAQVMIHRAAARHPPDHFNPVCFHILQVDFCQRILKLPDNNRRCIQIKQKNILGRELFQQIFFRSNIKIRILGG